MKGLNWKSFHEKRQQERSHILKRPWHPNAHLEDIGLSEFNSFVRSAINTYPGYLSQMYGWYAPPDVIDFVGRTESLVEDLLEALENAGIDVDEEAVRNTEKVNTSPQRVNRPDWDDDLRDAVRRLEAPAFERFEYE
jgi:hypothetical protein